MRQPTAAAIALCLVMISAAADDKATQGADERMTQEEAKKLKSPVPFNTASIARGRTLFLRDCKECHGADGKSQVDVVANATDLTEPKYWTSGTTEGEVFRSIRDGRRRRDAALQGEISKTKKTSGILSTSFAACGPNRPDRSYKKQCATNRLKRVPGGRISCRRNPMATASTADGPDATRRSFLLSSAVGAGARGREHRRNPYPAGRGSQYPVDHDPQGNPRLDEPGPQAGVVRRPGHDRRRGLCQALQGRRAGGHVLLPRQLHGDQRHRGGRHSQLRRAHRRLHVRRRRRLFARHRRSHCLLGHRRSRASRT